MFFQNVLHHWVVLTIYVVLILLTSPTLDHFWKRVLSTDWYRNTRYALDDMPKLSRWIGWAILASVLLSIRFLTAPFLWVVMILVEARERKHEAEKNRERQEKDRIVQAKKSQENRQRFEARKQWFTEHLPKLYCKTVSGITAVLKPADYEAAQKETKAARLNGFWDKDGVLRIYRETLIFVTKQGDELIKKNVGGNTQYIITGWMSQLTEVIEAGNVELIHVDDIFVPWVNEALMSFKEQGEFMRQRSSNTYSLEELVEKQAPANLQHIR